ncbi:hypothetical protein ACFWMJ_23995 [Streptomyces hawaiiensis]|uniref:hypothetical protein n=1 Tax=Streptomyces hawaiiensis TaxID=67305 RepID=UPI003665C7D1
MAVVTLLTLRLTVDNRPVIGWWGGVSLAAVLFTGLSVLMRLPRHRAWAVSIWTSVVFIAAIGVIWAATLTARTENALVGTPVASDAQVNRYLGDSLPPGRETIRVPTGVYIESIKFIDANDAEVSGYVWQRYARSVPAEIKRGVVLVEAGDSYDEKEVYRYRHGDDEVIGWYFNTTFRQKFDYGKYPLDRQNVWLRMWHPEMNRSVVLTPDMASYPPWKQKALYGIDPGFVPGSWTLRRTAFSYSMLPDRTSFGIGRYTHRTPVPELYFNVTMSREFISPLMGRLIPFAFMATLAFAALFIITRRVDRYPLTGFDSLALIGFAASILLVLAVDHTSVRQETGSHGVSYIECFYASMYVVITLLVVNSVLLTKTDRIGVLDWRDNLLPKILYWPVITFLVFCVTAGTFV